MLADESHGETLADGFEYAMHGRIFKYSEADAIRVVYTIVHILFTPIPIDSHTVTHHGRTLVCTLSVLHRLPHSPAGQDGSLRL